MAKLWETGGSSLDADVEKFLSGDDLVCDQRLIPNDILGNAAQARVLVRAGVLSRAQGARLVKALKGLHGRWKSGKLVLKLSDEDVHTRIELELTKSLGDLGKRIHTGRSRNDQVLTDIALWTREALHEITASTLELSKVFLGRVHKLNTVAMPGYTHMQRAMPMTAGFWMGSWAEAFSPRGACQFLASSLEANDAGCPLGSASGFGSLVSPDRNYAALLLGFRHGEGNALRVQTSRGRVELAVLHATVQLLIECNRFASDVLLFSSEEFGFVSLPPSLTTGSSLMPNKRNSDVCELIRSSLQMGLGDMTALVALQSSLPSGYNRDLQPSKGLLMRSVDRVMEVLRVTRKVAEGIQVNPERCRNACNAGVLATDSATVLSLSGIAFRDAYKSVKSGGSFPSISLAEAIIGKRAAGCPGNPGYSHLRRETDSALARVMLAQKHSAAHRTKLLSPAWRMGT